MKLSTTEKELHQLNYPFKTVPAMKIAKLAVSAPFQEKYTGIGSLMIEMQEDLIVLLMGKKKSVFMIMLMKKLRYCFECGNEG